MAKSIHYDNGTITASSGSGSVSISITNNVRMILENILVKSATASTTFDVTITDHLGNVTNQWLSNTGELNENNVGELIIGAFTLAIANASVDEAFTYLLKYDQT